MRIEIVERITQGKDVIHYVSEEGVYAFIKKLRYVCE